MKQDWSKSYLVRPHDHLQSHLLRGHKKFVPSYEREVSPLTNISQNVLTKSNLNHVDRVAHSR